MKVLVLLNDTAGQRTNHDPAGQIRRACDAAGVDAEVRRVHPLHLTDQARLAAREGYDAVVAAGGDGTVSAVAAGAIEANLPLGVLPMGTLNHFARDLGLPLDLDNAARVLALNHVQSIDVGEVNGVIFLNNSSIGVYPQMVKERDRQRQRLGRGKLLATLMAGIAVFRRFPLVRVRIGVGDQSILQTTPFVFVGNNRYRFDLLKFGERESLSRGELCLYMPCRTSRFGMLSLTLRGLFKRLDQARDFQSLYVNELWIESAKPSLRTAIDGEVRRLSPPLHYVIRPAALKVICPPSAPQTQAHENTQAAEGA